MDIKKVVIGNGRMPSNCKQCIFSRIILDEKVDLLVKCPFNKEFVMSFKNGSTRRYDNCPLVEESEYNDTARCWWEGCGDI